jgi:hypothetical protein
MKTIFRLWNEVGIQSPSHADFAEKQRNHIYKCLHDKIEQNYPLPMASTRLGSLLLLLNYLEVSTFIIYFRS